MPRPAATMIGLILVGLAIGFNMQHYPIVWEMVGPAMAAPAAQPTEALQTIEAEPPASSPPPPPSIPLAPIAVEPAEQHGQRFDAHEDEPDSEPAVEQPEAHRPLVPVSMTTTADNGEQAGSSSAQIRRLPQVDRPGPNLAAFDPVLLPGGTIPFYPTTGIE